MVYIASKIKKIAEISKKYLTNKISGCILAPSVRQRRCERQDVEHSCVYGAFLIFRYNQYDEERFVMTNVPEYFGSLSCIFLSLNTMQPNISGTFDIIFLSR